ncbi:Rne/Rng family ribonuclease [Clostridium niameyense]|uniref:Rne/Rng family ribonuclease n=1 Tax=Clostridium niameyense TaxID=1622073 RepID=A0A6M0R673_9CLOT|nr:Rne/Rng family ribonuclease [Clostridium niameyense]NEZ45673.1 Rne/Rng family ribonuclease [Clostridium niameyense]
MKEIFIERQQKVIRIVIRSKDKLEEIYMEQEMEGPKPGEIYVGVVKNIIPSIKSAFIDIGFNKNAYMYLDKKFNNKHIKKGDYVLVQVVKEELNKKGAKVTNAISIPGRYVVIETLNKDISFSKKIKDIEFKEYILKNIVKPKDIGIMLRTNSINVDMDIINSEITEIVNIYKDIIKKSKCKMKAGILLDNGGIIGKILRDRLDDKTDKIYTNSGKDYNYIKEFLNKYSKIKTQLTLYDGERTLLDYYGIEKHILSLRKNRVYLKCGGYIVIDKTEAMYVIDVNSGKNIKSGSMNKTAFITNMEAAEKISEQVLLRNLSGIIVIDFIDMEHEENKIKVLNKLQDGFKNDKNKTVIYPFTELSLVQIARRRQGRTIYEYIEEPCNFCRGNGSMLKFSYIKLLIKNEIITLENKRQKDNIYIEIDDRYKKYIEENKKQFIQDINCNDKKLYLKYVENKDYYKVQPLVFNSQIEELSDFMLS